ncbi:hypothetical protein COBT_000102 [Conglomerata obtusa]
MISIFSCFRKRFITYQVFIFTNLLNCTFDRTLHKPSQYNYQTIHNTYNLPRDIVDPVGEQILALKNFYKEFNQAKQNLYKKHTNYVHYAFICNIKISELYTKNLRKFIAEYISLNNQPDYYSLMLCKAFKTENLHLNNITNVLKLLYEFKLYQDLDNKNASKSEWDKQFLKFKVLESNDLTKKLKKLNYFDINLCLIENCLTTFEDFDVLNGLYSQLLEIYAKEKTTILISLKMDNTQKLNIYRALLEIKNFLIDSKESEFVDIFISQLVELNNNFTWSIEYFNISESSNFINKFNEKYYLGLFNIYPIQSIFKNEITANKTNQLINLLFSWNGCCVTFDVNKIINKKRVVGLKANDGSFRYVYDDRNYFYQIIISNKQKLIFYIHFEDVRVRLNVKQYTLIRTYNFVQNDDTTNNIMIPILRIDFQYEGAIKWVFDHNIDKFEYVKIFFNNLRALVQLNFLNFDGGILNHLDLLSKLDDLIYCFDHSILVKNITVNKNQINGALISLFNGFKDCGYTLELLIYELKNYDIIRDKNSNNFGRFRKEIKKSIWVEIDYENFQKYNCLLYSTYIIRFTKKIRKHTQLYIVMFENYSTLIKHSKLRDLISQIPLDYNTNSCLEENFNMNESLKGDQTIVKNGIYDISCFQRYILMCFKEFRTVFYMLKYKWNILQDKFKKLKSIDANSSAFKNMQSKYKLSELEEMWTIKISNVFKQNNIVLYEKTINALDDLIIINKEKLKLCNDYINMKHKQCVDTFAHFICKSIDINDMKTKITVTPTSIYYKRNFSKEILRLISKILTKNIRNRR